MLRKQPGKNCRQAAVSPPRKAARVAKAEFLSFPINSLRQETVMA
jgi:hypothetical protein